MASLVLSTEVAKISQPRKRMLSPRCTGFARCSRWCSTPLRLLIALLALMSVCLCAMIGISVLANLVYAVIIPALARTGSAGRAGSLVMPIGHVIVAVLAAILVIETTIYFISALGVLISQLSFVGWFRSDWRVLLLAGGDKGSSRDVLHSRRFWPLLKTTTVLSAAADVAEQSFVALIACCTCLSLLLAIWWRTGERASAISPDPEASATAPLGPPSSSALLGAETYVKDALRIGIMLHSMAIFIGTIALLVSRALWAVGWSIRGWYLNPKLAHMEARARAALIAAYLLASPFLLFLVPLAFLATRCCKRVCPSRGTPLYDRLALQYLHTPLFEFSDRSSTGARAGVGGQALLFLTYGVGDSAWHNFLAGLRNYTAWYAFLWFIGSLVYAVTHPGVVAVLGVIGGVGCTVTGRRCIKRSLHTCKKAMRADAVAVHEDTRPAALDAAHTPSTAPSQKQTLPAPLTSVIVQPERTGNEAPVQTLPDVTDTSACHTAESLEEEVEPSESDGGPPPTAPALTEEGSGSAAAGKGAGVAVPEGMHTSHWPVRSSAPVLPMDHPPGNARVHRQPSLGVGAVAGSIEAWLKRDADGDGVPDASSEDVFSPTAEPGEDVLRAVSRHLAHSAGKGGVSLHAVGRRRKFSTQNVLAAAKVARRGMLIHAAHVHSMRHSDAHGAPSPLAKKVLTDQQQLLLARSVADSEVDALCAWGSILLGLTLIACILGFIIKPALGGAMAILTAFLSGSWCMRRPPHGKGSVVCKILLVLVAAVYGVFTSSYSSEVGASTRFLLSPAGTWDNSTAGAARESSSRAYDSCSMVINGITPLDHCFLALSAYSPARIRDADMSAWFGAAGRSVVPQPMNRSDSGLQLAAYKLLAQAGVVNDTDRLLVMIRGTATQRDVAQDALVWQEVMLFQLFSMVGPFGTWPNSVKRRFVGIVAAIEGAFGVEDSLRYTEEAVEDVRTLTSTYPTLPLSVSGHSLGGGLSTLVGQRVKVPSVSFSGPGVALSAHKLRITGELSYDLNTVFLPDHDVVPLIDEQVGTVQNIRCLRASSALDCHSIARTCCELRRSCGDPYGRTMMRCPVINGVAPAD